MCVHRANLVHFHKCTVTLPPQHPLVSSANTHTQPETVNLGNFFLRFSFVYGLYLCTFSMIIFMKKPCEFSGQCFNATSSLLLFPSDFVAIPIFFLRIFIVPKFANPVGHKKLLIVVRVWHYNTRRLIRINKNLSGNGPLKKCPESIE